MLEGNLDVITDGNGNSVYVERPTAKIISISKYNVVTIQFSRAMTTFDIDSYSDAYTSVSIIGPMSSYSFDYTSKFISSTKVEFTLNLKKQIVGRTAEKLKIQFNQDYFTSTDGANLGTDYVDTYIYQMSVAEEVINAAGSTITSLLLITLGILIMTNVLLGDEIELLWGFMNTLQIISYFPFLKLYMPQFLAYFIKSLQIANLQLPFGFIDDTIESINNAWLDSANYDIENDDPEYSDNGISSSSVLRNAARLLVLLFQGLIVAFILYSLKAKLVTIPDAEASKKKVGRRSIYEVRNVGDTGVLPYQAPDRKMSVKQWLKLKLVDMCREYRYHFFIRLGFQVYLEICLIVCINLGYTKFNNWVQTVSYFVALIGFC